MILHLDSPEASGPQALLSQTQKGLVEIRFLGPITRDFSSADLRLLPGNPAAGSPTLLIL